MDSVNKRYYDLVDKIITTGESIDSRFGETIELDDQQFSFNPGDILARKGQNLRVGWCELVQLIAGIYDGEAFKKYSPNSDQSLFTYEMNYGLRTVGQITGIIRTLTRDPHNRECYLFIGRPGESGTPNLPCTLGIRYRIRNNYLYGSAFMRSLDVLKGLPVDLIMFGGLTQMIANCIGVLSGLFTITAGSAHVYTADVEAGKLPVPNGKHRVFDMPVLATHKDYLMWALNQADWHWEDIPGGIHLKTY